MPYGISVTAANGSQSQWRYVSGSQLRRNQLNKANPRKEFFRVDLTQIRAEIERLGIETKWTLAAEARECRQSLAIEKALANNTLDQAEWEKFQLENASTEAEMEAEEQEV